MSDKKREKDQEAIIIRLTQRIVQLEEENKTLKDLNQKILELELENKTLKEKIATFSYAFSPVPTRDSGSFHSPPGTFKIKQRKKSFLKSSALSEVDFHIIRPPGAPSFCDASGFPEVNRQRDEFLILSSKWDKEQFIQWLIEHNLSKFIGVFTDDKLTEESKMFEVDKYSDKCIKLHMGSVQNIMDLLFLPKNSMLHCIFDYKVFVLEFLISFKSFTSKKQVLDFLKKSWIDKTMKFDDQDTSRKDTIVYILQVWLEINAGIESSDSSKDWMATFLNIKDQTSEILFNKLKTLQSYGGLLRSLRWKRDLTKAPEIELPAKSDFKIIDISPGELARQITLLLEDSLDEVKMEEFLSNAYWSKKNSAKKAPNLHTFIKLTNHLRALLITEILKHPYKEDRAALIVLFIRCAKKLREMNNFMGIFIFIAALEDSAVRKLKKTWEIVERSKLSTRDMMMLVSNQNRFRAYLEILHQIPDDTPYIPILPIHLGDLEKLNEVLEDVLDDPSGWICWHKMRTVAKIVWEIKRPRPQYLFRYCLEVSKRLKESESWKSDKINYTIAVLRENQENWDRKVENIDSSVITNQDETLLTEQDWLTILTLCATKRVYSEGKTIAKKGFFSGYFCKIESGIVEALKDGKDANELDKSSENVQNLSKQLTENEIFGEYQWYQKDKEHIGDHTNYIAKTKVVLYEIDINSLIDLCHKDSTISTKLNYTLARRLVNIYKTARNIINKNEAEAMNDKPRTLTGSAKARVKARTKGATSSVSNDAKPFFEDFGVNSNEKIIRTFHCHYIGNLIKFGGELFVTTKYFLFKGKNFNHTKYIARELKDVEFIKHEKKSIKINDQVFTGFEKVEQAYLFLKTYWKNNLKRSNNEIEEEEEESTKNHEEVTNNLVNTVNKMGLTDEEWEEILTGSETITYKHGQHLVKSGGSLDGKMYYIVSGKCNVIVKENVVATMGEQSFYGEIDFLEPTKTGATADIVAVEETEVTAIPSYFLNVMFQHKPHLSGKFYFLIGEVLWNRLVENACV